MKSEIDMYNIIFSSLITFNKHVDNPQGIFWKYAYV